MPFLRPLLATILPNFFSAHNFTSLFANASSKSQRLGDAHEANAGKSNSTTDSTTRGTMSSCSKGDVTITTEFHLEEMGPGQHGGAHGGADGHGFDSRPLGTPTTPLAPRMGFRATVTCEKGDVV